MSAISNLDNMVVEPRSTKEYLYGVPELLILRLLADREMYGYEIVRDIRIRSGDQMKFGEAVIYPIVHSLEKRRLLKSRRDTINGRLRIYYRLTKTGEKMLHKKMSNWYQVNSVIKNILDGKPNGETSKG